MPPSLKSLCLLLPTLPHPPRWASDFFNASSHFGNGTDQLICIDKGRVTLGERDHLNTKHIEREICLAPGGPGQLPLNINAAIFEVWNHSGYIFVSLYALKDLLVPQSDHMGWKWWSKKKGSLETSIRRYQLGNLSYRPGIPIGRDEGRLSCDRCLPYPSLSIRLLVVTCLKSVHTSTQQKGRVTENDVREAMATLLDRMLLHLPMDSGAHGGLVAAVLAFVEWGAKWVGPRPGRVAHFLTLQNRTSLGTKINGVLALELAVQADK